MPLAIFSRKGVMQDRPDARLLSETILPLVQQQAHFPRRPFPQEQQNDCHQLAFCALCFQHMSPNAAVALSVF